MSSFLPNFSVISSRNSSVTYVMLEIGIYLDFLFDFFLFDWVFKSTLNLISFHLGFVFSRNCQKYFFTNLLFLSLSRKATFLLQVSKVWTSYAKMNNLHLLSKLLYQKIILVTDDNLWVINTKFSSPETGSVLIMLPLHSTEDIFTKIRTKIWYQIPMLYIFFSWKHEFKLI